MSYDSIANLKSSRKHEYIVCQSTSIAELTNSATPCIKRSGVRDFGGDYQPATGEAEQITQTRHGA